MAPVMAAAVTISSVQLGPVPSPGRRLSDNVSLHLGCDLQGAAQEAASTPRPCVDLPPGVQVAKLSVIVPVNSSNVTRFRLIARYPLGMMGSGRRLQSTTAPTSVVLDANGNDVSSLFKTCCFSDGYGVDSKDLSSSSCPSCSTTGGSNTGGSNTGGSTTSNTAGTILAGSIPLDISDVAAFKANGTLVRALQASIASLLGNAAITADMVNLSFDVRRLVGLGGRRLQAVTVSFTVQIPAGVDANAALKALSSASPAAITQAIATELQKAGIAASSLGISCTGAATATLAEASTFPAEAASAAIHIQTSALLAMACVLIHSFHN